MINLPENSNFYNPISQQWDCNAQARFEELNLGQDDTYRNILCPVLFKLLHTFSEGRSVLDVGCGLGFFSDYIQKRGFEVSGVDVSSKCISIARKKFPALKLYNEDIIDFLKTDSCQFDACIVNMVFHNMPNVETVAAAISVLLKSKGVLIGCIPHPVFWFNRRVHKAKRISAFGENAYLTPFQIRGAPAHPVPFTYFHRQLEDYWHILTQAGFSEVQAISAENVSGLPNDLIFFVAKKL